MQQQEPNIINQDENPLKNYTVIPNIVFELGLSPSAIALYTVLRRIVGFNDSVTWKSRAALAKKCNMSTGQITKAKDELIKHGLIEVRKRDSLKHETDITIIVNLWERNHQHFTGQTGHNMTAGFHNVTNNEQITGHNMTAGGNNMTDLNILEEVNNKNKSTDSVTSDGGHTKPDFSEEEAALRKPVAESQSLSPKPILKSGKEKSVPTTLPRPFKVTTDMQKWARENVPLVDWKLETQKLTDWALSKAAKKVDWVATWRNWLRTTQERLAAAQPKISRRPTSVVL